MKVGVRVPPSEPLTDVIALVRKAEANGLAHTWFPDSHLNYGEVWTVMGAVASHTQTIGLGPAVTNLSTRHPSVTASAACSIADVIGDRLILGIGAGDSAIGYSGLLHADTASLRRGIADLRRWISGDPPEGEPDVRLRHGGATVPIYLAASGPANLRLAAEVADGVITPLANLARKLRLVDEATTAAHRADRAEVVVNTMCMVTDDLERDVMLLAPFVVRTAQMEGLTIFEEAGIHLRVPDHLVGAAGDMGHPSDIVAAAADAAAWVTREAAMFYATNCCLAGTSSEIADALAALGRSGVGRVNVAGPPGLPWELVDVLGSAVDELSGIASRPRTGRTP